MRKKFALLSLFFLLFALLTGAAQASAKLPLKAAPLSPAFLKYQESMKQPGALSSRGAASGTDKLSLGVHTIPSPVDLSHLKNADYSAYFAAKEQRALFPVSYDLRAHGAVTRVEDQNPHGTCWAFASIGSLESVYLKRTGTELNLSELHLAYYAYQEPFKYNANSLDVLDSGGFNNQAVAVLAHWTGAVLEEELPYDHENPVGPSSNYPNRLHLQDAFFLGTPPISFLPEATDPTEDIRKELIMSYGGIDVIMGAGNLAQALRVDNNVDSWCNLPETTPDHAVLVVGWDDNYSKENFEALEDSEGNIISRKPSVDGAWLVKNSWGTNHMDGGYFWLSYEDDSLMCGTVFIPEEVTNYDNLYDYDELGWCNSLGNENTLSMANVFQARNSETLQAVSFYTTDANAEYEISVYTGLSNASVPTSGTRAAFQTGSQPLAGYHTVKLNTPVSLTQGTSFAIAVKMTTPTSTFPIAVESRIPYYSDNVVINPGVSFISLDDDEDEDDDDEEKDWFDLAVYYDSIACIKAFTTNSGTPASGTGGGGCDAGAMAGMTGILPLALWALWASNVKRTGRR